MTLNFDILTSNNASWGFEPFSLVPAATAAPVQPEAPPRAVSECFFSTAAPPLPPPAHPRAMSASLQSLGGHNASCGDNEENVSPMKNDALFTTMLASDPAARAFDSNLYVASLPDWFTDADLYDLFKRFGPILSAKVMCHKGTHHCKGYGFVLFQRTDDAAQARSEMIGHVVGGNKIQVRRARSAASAPLGEGAGMGAVAAASLTGFADHPRHVLQSPPNGGSLNVSPHLVASAPQPLNPLYSAAPAYVVSGSSAGNSAMGGPAGAVGAGGQPMFVAIPSNRGGMPGPDNYVYMMVTSPQLQASSVIY